VTKIHFADVAQYQNHTEAIIESMKKFLEEFHCHKDDFSLVCTRKSTDMVLVAFKQLPTLDTHEEWHGNPGRNMHSVAAKHHRADEHEIQIKSDIPQHLVHESDFNLVQEPFLNRFSDHIRQLCNLLNATSGLPEAAIIDRQQA